MSRTDKIEGTNNLNFFMSTLCDLSCFLMFWLSAFRDMDMEVRFMAKVVHIHECMSSEENHSCDK